jgi:hypothetical protein
MKSNTASRSPRTTWLREGNHSTRCRGLCQRIQQNKVVDGSLDAHRCDAHPGLPLSD